VIRATETGSIFFSPVGMENSSESWSSTKRGISPANHRICDLRGQSNKMKNIANVKNKANLRFFELI
jgi:hypothetical protein